MPRGSRDGSVIIIPAERDPRTKKVVAAEKVFVRYRYTDPLTGRRREKKRLAENLRDVPNKREAIRDEIKRERLQPVEICSHTFAELTKIYRNEYLAPAKYVFDVRVSGLRSWKRVDGWVTELEREFGDEPLVTIDYERILSYKRSLQSRPVIVNRTAKPKRVRIGKGEYELRQPPACTRERGITSVNRQLEVLRRLLEIARRRLHWIPSNPFRDGDSPLIQRSLEQERMVILTHAQEKALLAACVEPRAHLKLALLWALDTAMRPNEQFSCAWSDVHLDDGYITITSRRAKRERRRIVPITARLAKELKEKHQRNAGGRELVFEHHRHKRAFATARRLAGLEGVRWQDLRHTAIMRMLDAIKDSAKVKKICGHTSDVTFMRYVNLNPELARELGRAMDLTARATLRYE